jgi:hypothetical protein
LGIVVGEGVEAIKIGLKFTEISIPLMNRVLELVSKDLFACYYNHCITAVWPNA